MQQDRGREIDDDDDDGDGERGDERPKYAIVIEYDDFLTRYDLDEVLSSIDLIIEQEIFAYYDPDYRFWRRRYPFAHWPGEEPALSYVGITGVEQGSIVLTVLASSAVAAYVARRFKKGVDKSILAEQLERSGQLSGDVFGLILARVNDWAEQYVPKQQEVGGKIRKVRAVKRKSDPRS